MKKILFFSLVGSLLFSANIKNSEWFVDLNYGKIKINDTTNMYGIKVGYYFYETNTYKIGNRIYGEIKKIDIDNSDFYINSIKLDWIANNSSPISPYVGINIGYIYYRYNNNNYDTNIWGAQGGLLIFIKNKFQIDLSVLYSKPYSNKTIWNNNIKTIEGGIGISF